MLVGASFACISPFTCAVCYLYFVAAYEAGKHALCCLETMPFDTRGALWFDGVAQTHTALFIALVVQLVVLWFNITNKGFWPVWKSTSAPSGRCSYGDNVASMAWGARNLISTQVLAGHRRHPHPVHVEALPGQVSPPARYAEPPRLGAGQDAAEGRKRRRRAEGRRRRAQCINQIVAARRRDASYGVPLWSITTRSSQHGRVLAEK